MTTPSDPTSVEHFRREGYCVIPDALSSDEVAMLRDESALAVAWQEEAIRSQQGDVENLNRLDQRYFIPRRSSERPRLRELIVSERMARTVGPLLSKDAFLFIDVFVFKHERSASDFGWHQDHGYVAHYGFGHFEPNVTVWTPLEDVTDANGALHVLPFSRSGGSALVPHVLDPSNNDCVADVEEAGECIEMPVGSLLVMSGLLLHRSGPNTTSRPRPAFQWQYSPAPVVNGESPISLSVPFLAEGRWVPPPRSR